MAFTLYLKGSYYLGETKSPDLIFDNFVEPEVTQKFTNLEGVRTLSATRLETPTTIKDPERARFQVELSFDEFPKTDSQRQELISVVDSFEGDISIDEVNADPADFSSVDKSQFADLLKSGSISLSGTPLKTELPPLFDK